ncbi:MAG: VacJ family lipoprotein [Burkholderiales bacterium]
MIMLDKLKGLLLALLIACCAGGCATSGTPGDPFEGFNRAMFGFNEGVDKAVLQPVAKGYKTVVPEPARECVGNVFANINDIFVGLNSLLQGKFGDAVSDVCRVVVNTTVGLLGCFDVASKLGLEKHDRDFGQTFGKWGFGPGPYLVLPFLGPQTVREGIGTLIYTNLDPVWADHVRTRNVLYSLRAVNRRAELLEAGNVLEEAALDKYSFVRDAYLQRRQGMIDNDNRTSALRVPSAVALNAAESLPRRLPANIWVDAANQRVAQRAEALVLPAPRTEAPRQALAGIVVREF